MVPRSMTTAIEYGCASPAARAVVKVYGAWPPLRQRRGQVVVRCAGRETGDEHVVVVGARCRVGNGRVRGCRVVEVVLGETPSDLGPGDVLKRVPADDHAVVAVVRQANLAGGVRAAWAQRGEDGGRLHDCRLDFAKRAAVESWRIEAISAWPWHLCALYIHEYSHVEHAAEKKIGVQQIISVPVCQGVLVS